MFNMSIIETYVHTLMLKYSFVCGFKYEYILNTIKVLTQLILSAGFCSGKLEF